MLQHYRKSIPTNWRTAELRLDRSRVSSSFLLTLMTIAVLVAASFFLFQPLYALAQTPLPAAPPADYAPTNYATQFAEQNFDPGGILSRGMNNLLAPLGGFMNIIHDLISAFFDALIKPIGQIVGAILAMFIKSVMGPFVTYLMGILKWFVLNPNIPLAIDNGGAAIPSGTPHSWDPTLHNLQVLTEQVKTVSLDLSLVLFVLAIWRRWVDGAFKRGGESLMGPVGRLIFTMSLILTWPQLLKYELMITNEMVKAIFFNSPVEFELLNTALKDAMIAAIAAGTGLAAEVFAPFIGKAIGGAAAEVPGGIVGGAIGEVIGWIGLVMFAIFGAILIKQLCHLLVMKAVQTGIMTGQYVFKDFFIVALASPDTEHVGFSYFKSCIEVSLWSWTWLVLFKIMVIVLASKLSWGKLLIVIGLLEIMLQIPAWLGKAQIGPASHWLEARVIAGLMKEGLNTIGNLGRTSGAEWSKWNLNGRYSRGGSDSTTTTFNGFGAPGGAPGGAGVVGGGGGAGGGAGGGGGAGARAGLVVPPGPGGGVVGAGGGVVGPGARTGGAGGGRTGAAVGAVGGSGGTTGAAGGVAGAGLVVPPGIGGAVAGPGGVRAGAGGRIGDAGVAGGGPAGAGGRTGGAGGGTAGAAGGTALAGGGVAGGGLAGAGGGAGGVGGGTAGAGGLTGPGGVTGGAVSEPPPIPLAQPFNIFGDDDDYIDAEEQPTEQPLTTDREPVDPDLLSDEERRARRAELDDLLFSAVPEVDPSEDFPAPNVRQSPIDANRQAELEELLERDKAARGRLAQGRQAGALPQRPSQTGAARNGNAAGGAGGDAGGTGRAGDHGGTGAAVAGAGYLGGTGGSTRGQRSSLRRAMLSSRGAAGGGGAGGGGGGAVGGGGARSAAGGGVGGGGAAGGGRGAVGGGGGAVGGGGGAVGGGAGRGAAGGGGAGGGGGPVGGGGGAPFTGAAGPLIRRRSSVPPPPRPAIPHAAPVGRSPVRGPLGVWLEEGRLTGRFAQGDADSVTLGRSGKASATYGPGASLWRRSELAMVAAVIQDSGRDGGFQSAARRSVTPTRRERMQAGIIGIPFVDTEAGKARAREEMAQGTMHYITGGREGRDNEVSQYLTANRGAYGDDSQPDRGFGVRTDMDRAAFRTGAACMAAEFNPTVDAQTDRRFEVPMRWALGYYMEQKLMDAGQNPGSYDVDYAREYAMGIEQSIPLAAYTLQSKMGDGWSRDTQLVEALASVGEALGGSVPAYAEALHAITRQLQCGESLRNAQNNLIRLHQMGFSTRELLDYRYTEALRLHPHGRPLNANEIRGAVRSGSVMPPPIPAAVPPTLRTRPAAPPYRNF